MTAKFDITQELHIVNALPPLDIDAAAQASKFVSMKGAGVVYFILQLGVTGAASTVTVEEATSAAGAGNTPIAFDYRAEETDAGDTLGDWTSATSAGFATSTNDNIFYVIRVAVEALSKGSPYVGVALSDPGAATFGNILAVLGDINFQQNVTKTVLT